MTIRADSYSSIDEVVAFTARLLDGQASFNAVTQPTLAQVEKFIDRASGALNVALMGNGFAAKAVIANSTAKLICDDWVTAQASEYVELTQAGAGFNENEGSRTKTFASLYKSAKLFSNDVAKPFAQLGIVQAHPVSEGLAFTASTDQNDRDDPNDNSLEQPLFTRRQFDNHQQTLYGLADDESQP